MKIGVLANKDDRQADAIRQALERLAPACSAALDLGLGPEARFTMTTTDLRMHGLELSEFDAVLVSGFPYMDPVVPAPATAVDWSVWNIDYVLEQQRFSTQYSLLEELQRRGVELINPAAALRLSYTKHELLRTLHTHGLNVPATLCSNENAAVVNFCERFERVVWRPVTGRAAWQLFLERQRQHLVGPDKPPILLAEAIEGPLVRVWLWRGEPLLCLAHAAPDASGLELTETLWAVTPQEAGAAQLAGACAALLSPWLQLTYTLAGGRAWIMDADPDPRLDWLPTVHREYLIGRLARRLLGRTAADSEPDVPERVESRELPFLRRMLRDLFVYEASKYPDPDGEER